MWGKNINAKTANKTERQMREQQSWKTEIKKFQSWSGKSFIQLL